MKNLRWRISVSSVGKQRLFVAASNWQFKLAQQHRTETWSGQRIANALHRALGGTKHERTKFSFTDGLRDLPERKERNERNIQERRGSTLREHVLYGSEADVAHSPLRVRRENVILCLHYRMAREPTLGVVPLRRLVG